ncbi:DUF397 domain-containing protein [Nocardiopsis composta]|uniref:DUF397 domain-containing protein n=1 Tax=Nocardiopsis composta TaxID=157465 RepID=A0A7W8QQF5_9ACTN|nr:DUF397 domain-containing protein [Nocardiopsis composta]MBB5434025.1 hypothetical protein [Nocardiopsis composta]
MHSFPDGASWRTSSYTQQQNCVEVADAPGVTAIRDTKNRERGALLFSSGEWQALVEGAKHDRF